MRPDRAKFTLVTHEPGVVGSALQEQLVQRKAACNEAEHPRLVEAQQSFRHQQDAQAVNVAARINIQPAHLRLLGTHIRRRPDELLQLRVNRRIGQSASVALQCRNQSPSHRHASCSVTRMFDA